MDKHWKDIKVGDIVELNFLDNKEYYKLCEGEFQKATSLFYGKYFKYIGTNQHWLNDLIGEIYGYEILDFDCKIVDKLPDNLYT